MSEWVPLYISLAIIFIIGGIMPLFLNEYGSNNLSDYSDYDGVTGFVANGINYDTNIPLIPNITINPFKVLGTNAQLYIANGVNGFSLMSPLIAIPLLILLSVGLVYTIFRILETLIP